MTKGKTNWIVVTVLIVVIVFFFLLFWDKLECKETKCQYDRLQSENQRMIFICKHLVEEDKVFRSLYNMSENIKLKSLSFQYDIDYENGVIDKEYINKKTGKKEIVVCGVPVKFRYYNANVFDYYLQLYLRPLVVVKSWEDWIVGKEVFKFEEIAKKMQVDNEEQP